MTPSKFRAFAFVLLAALPLALAAGCSDDSTDPDDDTTVTDPLIAGTLTRTTGLVDGMKLQDEVRIWIDADAIGLIEAMKLAGQTDAEAEAADDGWNFSLLSALDVPLFTPGDAVTIEMLGAAGGTQATLVFSTTDSQLDILVPSRGVSASLSGFNVVWTGGGSGATVVIELSSDVLEHTWSVTTENTGVYTLDASDLEGFPRGSCTIRVEAWSLTALTSVELGVGAMDLIMAGETQVQLSI